MVPLELPVATVMFPGSAVPLVVSDSVGKMDADGTVVMVESGKDVDRLKCVDVVVSDAGNDDAEPPGRMLLRMPPMPPMPASAVTPAADILTVSPELELTTTVAGGA